MTKRLKLHRPAAENALTLINSQEITENNEVQTVVEGLSSTETQRNRIDAMSTPDIFTTTQAAFITIEATHMSTPTMDTASSTMENPPANSTTTGVDFQKQGLDEHKLSNNEKSQEKENSTADYDSVIQETYEAQQAKPTEVADDGANKQVEKTTTTKKPKDHVLDEKHSSKENVDIEEEEEGENEEKNEKSTYHTVLETVLHHFLKDTVPLLDM
ncbi:hypothetical protein G6F68_012451 [Rhizopus microsporus]|nr:hypothetical protein G6F68_012451 [Rhizopus microsporus]